jgi:molybdopterin synthase catalytic subunit
MSFSLSDQPLDPATLQRALADPRAGACVTFEGWVRDHNDGRPVRALDYEAYPLLAEKEGARILAEARARFAVTAAVCVHRTGALAIGDLAVWVGVAAAHRGAAFDACRYLIDETKARVPIWKKEHYADGTSGWIAGASRGDFAGFSRGQ